MRKGVFLARIGAHVIFAGATRIHEFDFNVFSNPFQMTVAPQFPWIRGGGTASLFKRTIIGAASRMRFHFIGLTPDDIDTAAVGFPAGNTGSEVLVSVGEAAVMLFPECVRGRFRLGIASVPKNLNELLALVVCREATKRAALIFGNDVRDLVSQP